jgi:hypothetical protein
MARGIRGKALHEHLRFACGRFSSVRAVYSGIRGLTDGRSDAPGGRAGSLLEPFEVGAALAGLHRQSVYRPLQLRGEAVAALRKLASEQPVQYPKPGGALISFDEVLEYNSRNPPVPFLYGSVPAADKDETALAIVNDPQILETATRYLGYVPRRRRPRLQWSFVCDVPAQQRRAWGQTVLYHYDSDDFNFVYTMFYLTETDGDSGAHAMLPGTHRGKPLSWLFGRTWRTDEEVFARYPPSDELLISGSPGFGFIQDSSCLHKARPPVTRERLVLQVRYS